MAICANKWQEVESSGYQWPGQGGSVGHVIARERVCAPLDELNLCDGFTNVGKLERDHSLERWSCATREMHEKELAYREERQLWKTRARTWRTRLR
jgi:hypothetical protein